MPTVFIIFGFIFKFYSDDHEAKYNIEPEVCLIHNHGFKKHELSMIESIIEENTEVIKDRWAEFFNKN